MSIENVTGSGLADVITGNTGNNRLEGDAGNDALYGGNGTDTLIGGAGADTLDGGSGTDTADYSTSSAAVNVNLATGSGSGGDAQGDVLTGIEDVIGTSLGARIAGDADDESVSGMRIELAQQLDVAGNAVVRETAGARRGSWRRTTPRARERRRAGPPRDEPLRGRLWAPVRRT